MTTSYSQEPLIDATRDAITSSAQFWADSVQKFYGWLPSSDGKSTGSLDAKVPTAEDVVDDIFAFYTQLLATNQAISKGMLAATNAVWAKQGAAKTGGKRNASPASQEK